MDGFGADRYTLRADADAISDDAVDSDSVRGKASSDDEERIVLWDPVTESRTYLTVGGRSGADQLHEAKTHIRNHQRFLADNIERLDGVLLKLELKNAVHRVLNAAFFQPTV